MSAVTIADIARAYHDAPDAPDADTTWRLLASASSGVPFIPCPGDPKLTPSILAAALHTWYYNDYEACPPIPVWAGEPPEYWSVAANCAFRAAHDRAHGVAYLTEVCTDEGYTLASELAALRIQLNELQCYERYAYTDKVVSAMVTEIIGQYACFATSGTFPRQRRVHLPPSMVTAILAGEVTA